MKKYYIPTSTLNFNNILSSESISPESFYSKREFGYPRWTSIPGNDSENVITLYDSLFRFERSASDVEDHPMMIEIESDDNFIPGNEGCFYCDHSIYLSPWTTSFIFFSEKDIDVSLSLSDRSSETKMLGLYRKKICIKHPDTKALSNEHREFKLNEQAIQQDRIINKMKGLLYGYYIGALLSTTPELVHNHNVLQELRDIFASVLSSESHRPTDIQKERISSLLFDLQKDNETIKYLKSVLNDPQKVKDVCKKLFNMGASFQGVINSNEVSGWLSNTYKENPALSWLHKQQVILKEKMRDSRTLLSPEKESIVICNYKVKKIAENDLKENDSNLVKIWVNEVLSSDKYNGKISSFKGNLADAVTREAKNIYGGKWDDSEAKVYLNSMRRYVNGNESDFQWNHLLYSSIAAVIAKGNDWEDMLKFMQSKNIVDYRLAFAFYGELNGFANLTRDFTDLLLNNEDRKYVSEVYREFSGQLLGINPYPKESAFVSEKPTVDNVSSTMGELEWKSGCRDYIEKMEIRQIYKDTALNVLNEKELSTPEKYFKCLSKEQGWKKSKAKQELFSYLNEKNGVCEKGLFDGTEQTSQQEEYKTSNDYNKSSMFDEYKNWGNKTAEFISDVKSKKIYIKDIKWFIDNHNETYEDDKGKITNGCYYGKSKENDDLIDRFSKFLKNQTMNDNPRLQWKKEIYNKIPIDKIIGFLKEQYGHR